MSLFSLIFGTKRKPEVDAKDSIDKKITPQIWDANKWAFVDTEVGLKDQKIHDIGALRFDGATFHQNDKQSLIQFLEEGNVEFICGHNIVLHDAAYLFPDKELYRHTEENSSEKVHQKKWLLVDTLYLPHFSFRNILTIIWLRMINS